MTHTRSLLPAAVAVAGIAMSVPALAQSSSCQDASDVDDNGLVDMADCLWLLGYFFKNGRAPAAPFLACGADGTADGLDCAGHASCE